MTFRALIGMPVRMPIGPLHPSAVTVENLNQALSPMSCDMTNQNCR